MKVLFCALGIYSSVGGMQQFNQRVVRCLSELRLGSPLNALVLVLWDGEKDREECPTHLRFFPCNCRKLLMLLRFARLLLREKPKIILYDHVLLVPLVVIARLLAPRARNILFAHGVEVWGNPGPLTRRIVSSFVQMIVPVSSFTSARMKRAYRLEDSRFALLPNAIDVPESRGANCFPECKVHGQYKLLTVARLAERYKGHHKIIQSMQTILRTFPDTHYYIVGDGPLRDELKAYANQAGVASTVHFLGWVGDTALATLYEKCDLFVMPSTGEGFGIVFLEAWKHKLAIIAGNKDASAEVIQHGVNGHLVDPDSVDEITGAIVSLLGDPTTRCRLARAGYEILSQKFTHPLFRKRLAEILLGSSLKAGESSAS